MPTAGETIKLVSRLPRKEQTGMYIVEVWEGTYDEVFALRGTLDSTTFWRIEDGKKPLYSIEISYPYDTDEDQAQTTKWELVGDVVTKDVYESNYVLYWVNQGIDDNGNSDGARDVVTIRDAIANPDPFRDVYEELLAVDPATGRKALWPIHQALARGTTSWQDAVYKLRCSRLVSAKYTGIIQDDWTLAIYAADQIVSETADYPMSERLLARVAGLDKFFTYVRRNGVSDIQNYFWGWLKMPTTETDVAGGKVQIQTEWVLDNWNVFLYDPKP